MDDRLLQSARQSIAAVASAENQLTWARAASRDALRELHHSGASLRDIATALSLSHQRVHQLVKETRDTRIALPTCSYCGADQSERQKVVVGERGGAICEVCAEAASTLFEHWAESGVDRRLDPALRVVVKESCSFCSKKAPRQVSALVMGLSRVAICAECLALCHEIYTDDPVGS